jgi:hypothetical protein
MAQSPIIKTMDDMLVKLKEAVRINRESETAVREYSDAIRALAQVCEDEDLKTKYLLGLEEATGKSGFMDAVRKILRGRHHATPAQIRASIQSEGVMDLTNYTNPLASIHTTLRRMKDKGEVQEITNDWGDKAYHITTEQDAQRQRKFGDPPVSTKD